MPGRAGKRENKLYWKMAHQRLFNFDLRADRKVDETIESGYLF